MAISGPPEPAVLADQSRAAPGDVPWGRDRGVRHNLRFAMDDVLMR